MSFYVAFKKSVGLKLLDISIEYVFWKVLQLDELDASLLSLMHLGS